MQKKIKFTDIENKTKIRFSCPTGSPDFSERQTHILIYFNNIPISFYEIKAELQVKKERQLNTFDLDIPNGANSIEVIISSEMENTPILPITIVI